LVVCIASGALLHAPLGARSPAPPFQQPAAALTIWDGVYTPAQAARGQQTYERACGSCHGVDLKGGMDAPALIGASFLTRYDSRPIAELFVKVAETMPQDAPGSLDPRTCAEVVSFVLKKQLVPGGDQELADDPARLVNIIVTVKPR
jgi:mono/diheme cytochrome c family protein